MERQFARIVKIEVFCVLELNYAVDDELTKITTKDIYISKKDVASLN
jgi:hypothetical protein